MNVLIDGDWLLFTAGFASQKTEYFYPGKYGNYRFTSLRDLKAALDLQDEEFTNELLYSRINVDPLEHALHSVKQMINTQVQRVDERFGTVSNVSIYVDGDGNFRNRIATIRPYKGNRPLNSKPLLYNEIYSYLLDVWSAEVVYDIETDDKLATLLTEHGDEGIIVGVDKDYLQVPGWHLNPNKGFKRVSEREGLERLYVQCLTGDTADNIGGCYKVGIKKAKPLIRDCDDEVEMWETVVRTYDQSIERYGEDIYLGKDGYNAAKENMRLVYLLRKHAAWWTRPERR